MTVLNLLDNLAELFGCRRLIINSAVQAVMNNDTLVKPTMTELIMLLHKANVPIRRMCEKIPIGNNTLYRYLKKYLNDPYEIKPKYSELQDIEISKFLKNLSQFFGSYTILELRKDYIEEGE